MLLIYITTELTDKTHCHGNQKQEREYIGYAFSVGENGIIDITADDFINVKTELKQVLDNKNRQSR